MELWDEQIDSQEDIQSIIKDISEGLVLLCPAPTGIDVERWVETAVKGMSIVTPPQGKAGEVLYKSYVEWVQIVLDESN